MKPKWTQVRWRRFPDEKPVHTGEYLVRGIGGLNGKLHYWVCLWVRGDNGIIDIPTGFYYNGNPFERQIDSNEYEWLDLRVLE